MNLKFWLAELFQPITPFEFTSTLPFEACVAKVQEMRQQVDWWRSNAETHLVMTPVDADTYHFSIERSGRRYNPIKGEGFIKRGDGVFTEITGQLCSNTLIYLLFGVGFASAGFLIVFLQHIDWLFLLILAPVALGFAGLIFSTGYITTAVSTDNLMREIRQKLGANPLPVHQPVKRKKKPND